MNTPEETIIHNSGMNYENFLKRAFKTDKRIERANKQEYINLANAENGKKLSILPSFDKQLEEVKNRLAKALIIFITNSNNDEQLSVLNFLKNKIPEIKSYKDVNKIIEIGLENTKEFI